MTFWGTSMGTWKRVQGGRGGGRILGAIACHLGTAYLTFLLFLKLFLMFVAINWNYVSYFFTPFKVIDPAMIPPADT